MIVAKGFALMKVICTGIHTGVPVGYNAPTIVPAEPASAAYQPAHEYYFQTPCSASLFRET